MPMSFSKGQSPFLSSRVRLIPNIAFISAHSQTSSREISRAAPGETYLVERRLHGQSLLVVHASHPVRCAVALRRGSNPASNHASRR
eukprot:6148767-Prymnesium_polylepis.1